MKKFIKKLISKWYWKYCFQDSNLANEIMVYWVPNAVRRTNGTTLDGKFMFAIINAKLKVYDPWFDVLVPAGLDSPIELEEWKHLALKDKYK